MAWLVTRPYVTAFLCAFLVLASRRMGWRRTIVWLVVGYGIALASEASSIHTGIPYGWYAYRYDQLGGDPLIFGVPVWDSLSYPFLIYAGWSLACWRIPGKGPWIQALLGAFFTMLLDVIIDPVARLGDRWFLGPVYTYTHPGWYFGVPLSNFLGWFVVPWVVIRVNQRIWRTTWLRGDDLIAPASRWDVALYLGIALFNIAVAFTIGAWGLGCCSIIVLALAWLTQRRLAGTSRVCRSDSRIARTSS